MIHEIRRMSSIVCLTFSFQNISDCSELRRLQRFEYLKEEHYFKAALPLLLSSLKTLASQATMSRMENSLKKKDVESLLD